MNTLFAKHILSVPTVSGKEDFFIDCIKKWCKIVGIRADQDGKGNLYLRKGDCDGKDWVPCLCSHLDTVHRKYIPYIEKKELLPVQIDGDRLFIDGMGIGADCKAGVAICLAVMRKVKRCKCALFVEEETGMNGSRALDKSFFDNVSYVLSWDSPGGNRATETSSGVPMFTKEFADIFKPIYAKHGVTSWNREPFTDTVQIVKQLGICCINARNGGGMAAHTDREDCSLKDMNDSEQLCLDAIAGIPCDRKWEIKYEEPKWEPSKWRSTGKSYGSKLSKEPDLDSDEDFGSYVDELFGLGGSSDDWQSHDDTEMCQFEFTYEDESQFERHKELCEEENLAIIFEDYNGKSETVVAEGELQEIKNAYVLWYQIFYDSPEVKTWEQLEDVDDLSEFNDGLIFLEDLDNVDDEIQPENLDDDAEEDAEEEEKEKSEQMDLFDWIDQQK